MAFSSSEHLRSVDVTLLETWCEQVPAAAVHVLPASPLAQLHLVRSGSYRARCHRFDVLVDPLTALFVPSDTDVETTHPQGDDTEVHVRFSLHLLSDIGGGCVDLPDALPLSVDTVLVHERALSQARNDGDPMAYEEAAIALVADCLRKAEPRRVDSGRPGQRRRRDVFADARAVLASDPTISSVIEVGRRVSCSPHHLSRIFSSYTGRGVSAYRTSLRIRQAMNRLSEGETDLARLAHDCGFADHAHMAHTFRRHLGATPSAVRFELANPNRPQSARNTDP